MKELNRLATLSGKFDVGGALKALILTYSMLLICTGVLADTAENIDRTVLPVPKAPFAGVVGKTPEQSRSHWSYNVKAPAGAPNVLLIMTDDVGFSATSTFGGSIPTPNLDKLAAHGLKYSNFYSTGICSPSRAALLTGRNHHMVSSGALVDMPTGYPGYSGTIPDSAATVADILKYNGYNTAMFGKHHNTPAWEASASGPFDRWPTGLGFEYFYGFLGGDADQFSPLLYRNQSRVEPIDTEKMLDEELADDAISWMHNQDAADSDKPFFMYFAPGSAHAPHQAPIQWIAKFKGKYDQGWEQLRKDTFERQRRLGIIPKNAVLTPKPDEIEAWQTLSAAQRKTFSRMMEVYAAMLAFQDAQIGRIINEIERMGEAENTLVLYVKGDNGGSAEAGNRAMSNEIGRIAYNVVDDEQWLIDNIEKLGGPELYQNYPVGWAWATNTPFKWTKQVASHLGGIRQGFVVSWPQAIKAKGELRNQFSHVIDLMPTILDAAGIPKPVKVNGVVQQRLDGVSIKPTFNTNQNTKRTQYFELYGNIGIYADGWFANNNPSRLPWQNKPSANSGQKFNQWELYNLNEDFSQSNDLSMQEPEKLQQMQQLFWQEARRNQVLPIDQRFATARSLDFVQAHPPTKKEFVYWGADVSVMPHAAPNFAARSFSISVDVDIPDSKSSGVLVANGSWFGGWSFYLKEGYVVALHAVSRQSKDIFRIQSVRKLTAGKQTIQFKFIADGGLHAGGNMRISVDSKPIGEGRIGRTILMTAGLGETFDIGRDSGVPVSDDYAPETLPKAAISAVRVSLGDMIFLKPS